MGPYNFPDLRPLFYFALFGMACGGIAVLGGLAWLAWFALNHVQIV